MSRNLLKGFIVSLGAGLAFGIGTKLGRSSPARRAGILGLEPLGGRLDNIEHRIFEVETCFANADVALDGDAARDILRMNSLLSAQNSRLDELRDEIQTIETRGAHRVLSFSRKLAEVEARLPAEIEANVRERIAALERKLQADFRQTHSRTVDLFIHAIDGKVVERISALEQSLADHSSTIASLREKSLSTDENLQELLAAVEKLCAQTPTRADIHVGGNGGIPRFAAHPSLGLGAEPARARSMVVSIAAVLCGFLGMRFAG
ncbi:MAG: hypothetical protein ACR2I2_19655 [Bryobacteraceae bacterium]